MNFEIIRSKLLGGLNFEIILSKLLGGLNFENIVIISQKVILYLYVLQETRNPPKVVENKFCVSRGIEETKMPRDVCIHLFGAF